MKVFISSDMEGTAGVVDWSQCIGPSAEYEYYRGLLQGEVNAAIEGALSAGATEFLVNDSHSSMQNLRPDALLGNARYLSGRHKPMYMMQGLDASFDAIFFVSYHGSMSSEASALSHTYNPRAISEVRLNDVLVGESGINALVAQAHRVPIVMITGDDTTASEATLICPDIHTAVVKTSVTRFAADSLHPQQARELIRNTAAAAMRDVALGQANPPQIAAPAQLHITFLTGDFAEMATWLVGVERVGARSVTITHDDPQKVFQIFVTVVALTRGIVE